MASPKAAYSRNQMDRPVAATKWRDALRRVRMEGRAPSRPHSSSKAGSRQYAEDPTERPSIFQVPGHRLAARRCASEPCWGLSGRIPLGRLNTKALTCDKTAISWG